MTSMFLRLLGRCRTTTMSCTVSSAGLLMRLSITTWSQYMLTAVEIADRTDIVYWREDLASSVGMPGGTVNLLNPMFSFTGTGYYTSPEPNIQPKFFQEPLFFQLPSTTT